MEHLTRIASQPSRVPSVPLPPGACDCHTHVFGPYDRFPLAPGRSYSPVAAPLPELLSLQESLSLSRVVIVQPSVYGGDNSCTVSALRALGDRARGIAVLDSAASPDTLRELHEAGMRGVRLNFMTEGTPPVGEAADALRRMADRIGPLGWHLQLFCTLATTAALASAIGGLGVPVVIDHFAWPAPDTTPQSAEWRSLLGLVRSGGAWVKLSAPHRTIERGMAAESLAALARSLAAANPERLVWGTDWPHPGAFLAGQAADALSPLHDIDDAGDLDHLAAVLDDPALFGRILAGNPARLYGFDPLPGAP